MPMGTEASLWAGSEILRLRRGFCSGWPWEKAVGCAGRDGALAEEEAKAAEDAQPEKKKQKKVVKTRLTPKQIMKLRAIPCHTVDDISPDTPASKSESLCRLYTMRWYIDGKWSDYLGVLCKQYECTTDLLGYAEDEDDRH